MKIRAFCWVSSFLLGAGLLVTLLAAEEAPGGMAWGKAWGGLAMCVESTKAEHILGESINLNLHITNVTSNEISLFDRYGGMSGNYKIEVFDSTRHSMQYTELVRGYNADKERPRRGSRAALRLGPGQTVHKRLVLNEWVKIDRAGDYTVCVTRVGSKDTEGSLVSNSLKIRVVLNRESPASK